MTMFKSILLWIADALYGSPNISAAMVVAFITLMAVSFTFFTAFLWTILWVVNMLGFWGGAFVFWIMLWIGNAIQRYVVPGVIKYLLRDEQ